MIAQAQRAHPELPVRRLCALLGIGRSWYYERSEQPTRAERDVALRDAIERIVLEFPGYGYRRVTKALAREGWAVNHKRVLRVMRQEALLCQLKRRFVATTDSGHALRTYPNLLAGSSPPAPTRCGWPTSPTSGCRPPSSTWPASSTPGPGAAWAGACRAASTRG